jgi:hypothetical protein
MKHLLNDLSEEEKKSIREQHTGGINLLIENFNNLVNSKSGEIKPLINESNITWKKMSNVDLFHYIVDLVKSNQSKSERWSSIADNKKSFITEIINFIKNGYKESDANTFGGYLKNDFNSKFTQNFIDVMEDTKPSIPLGGFGNKS